MRWRWWCIVRFADDEGEDRMIDDVSTPLTIDEDKVVSRHSRRRLCARDVAAEEVAPSTRLLPTLSHFSLQLSPGLHSILPPHLLSAQMPSGP